ncbi:anti-sigma factor family protein [Burkholderia gladioli]|uniref:anti-sigma factor family protein n=1 Tax=Burkholderia gladioli TaxID=28095 RepID=UPI0026541FD9|nr:hypothetical protein [Burkholderia gladioli]MDN7807853.1 hypothetical protein [Burkholderia gladioli]
MTSVPESIPSEQDVQAYADGRLAADREHSVSAYLARRPAEARRVAFYARVNAQLRNHFPDDGLAAAVLPLSAAPAALSVPPAQSTPALAAVPASRRRASRFGYRLAAAALLALLAAAVLPRLLRVPDHRLDTAAYAMLLALPGIDPAMGARRAVVRRGARRRGRQCLDAGREPSPGSSGQSATASGRQPRRRRAGRLVPAARLEARAARRGAGSRRGRLPPGRRAPPRHLALRERQRLRLPQRGGRAGRAGRARHARGRRPLAGSPDRRGAPAGVDIARRATYRDRR